MTQQELYDWIDSLAQDIEFEYNGVYGSICLFSRKDIALAYNGESVSVSSVEKAMSEPFICGKSLSEVCTELVFG